MFLRRKSILKLIERPVVQRSTRLAVAMALPVVGLSWLLIGPGLHHRAGLKSLAVGTYRCRIGNIYQLDCYLITSPEGGVSLDFSGPDADGVQTIDSFHGDLQARSGHYVVLLINTFSDRSGSIDRSERHLSTLLLRQTAADILDGVWKAQGKSLPFHMEKRK